MEIKYSNVLKNGLLKYWPGLKNIITTNYDVSIFIAAVLLKNALLGGALFVFGGISQVMAVLGSILLLTGLSLFGGRKTRTIVLLLLDIVVSFIFIADLVYYRYYNDVISTAVLMQVTLMDSVAESIFNLFRMYDLLFVLDIPVMAVIAVKAFRKREQVPVPRFRRRAVSAVAMLLAGSLMVGYGFYDVQRIMGKNIFRAVFDHTFFVSKVGLLNFHGFDAYSHVRNNVMGGSTISEAEKNRVMEYFKGRTEQTSGKRLEGSMKGKNLIVVQLEAFQNLFINREINGQEITPNLNKFIKRSIYFNNYYTQTGSGNTSDAEFLSNASFYPLSEGSVYFRCTGNEFETLPWLLRDQGYSTMSMHAYKASYWNRATMHPLLGFERFVSRDDYKIDETLGWGLSDGSFLRQSLKIMEDSKKPFYAFAITLSSHHPYEAFASDESFDAGPFNGTFEGNYIKGLHYADKALGEFFDELDRTGMMDKSVIVLYGDHQGLQKGSLDTIKSQFGLKTNNDLGWFQMLNIPLIIHLPGDSEAGVNPTVGGQVDLFPTLANLMGLKPEYSLGKDLLNTEKGYAVFRNGNVIDGETVYLKGKDKCYDWTSEAEVPKESFREYIDMAENDLYISDLVTGNNLIKYFRDQEP